MSSLQNISASAFYKLRMKRCATLSLYVIGALGTNLPCPECTRHTNGTHTGRPCNSTTADGLPNHGSVTQYLSHQPDVFSSSNLVLCIDSLNVYACKVATCHLPRAKFNCLLLVVISILFNDFI
jgi:hypothetical protein